MACDPFFDDVLLLVQPAGPNGSSSFVDLSPLANPITAANGAVMTDANALFPGISWALSADGAAYIRTDSIADGDPLDLPDYPAFTIEFWVRFTNDVTTLQSIGQLGTSSGLRLAVQNGQISAQWANAYTWSALNTSVGAIAIDTWYHVAIVRNGSNGRMYIDGVATVSTPADWTNNVDTILAGQMRFGAFPFTPFTGELGPIRITAAARYTANFTPPTDLFPLTQCAPTTVVPDVVGEDEAIASAEIEYVGLEVGAVTTQENETIPVGEVISQDPIGGTEVAFGSAVNLVVSSGPQICTGVPFEGYIAWPYLDFGLLGVDKMMEGFDIVADGTFRVAIGYSQRDFSLATPDYALDGDTLVGGMVPMPLTAPSYQFRITFDSEQSWQWFATNLYVNNLGIG